MLYQRELNVLGEILQSCCENPLTGWQRDGMCGFFPEDRGQHLICAEITAEFLDFSKSRGNDLSTATSTFPGLKPGDKWCVGVMRIIEAFNAGKAPKVDLGATNINVLEVIPLSLLNQMAGV